MNALFETVRVAAFVALKEHEDASHGGQPCLDERMNLIAWLSHALGLDNTPQYLEALVRRIADYKAEHVQRHGGFPAAKEEDLIKPSELIEAAQRIAAASDGRITVKQYGENDLQDSSHVLTMGNARIGRDLELYTFFGNSAIGWRHALAMILEELVLPLKGAPYDVACEWLREVGKRVYDGQTYFHFCELMDRAPAEPKS